MKRTEKEEYIIGSILLLSNKLSQVGDTLLPDITFKQWFLLMMISKMDAAQEKNIKEIAAFVGTTRQSVKKVLTPLEAKGYVFIEQSPQDARALKVKLTEKTYQYFSDHDASTAQEANQLFRPFTNNEIDDFTYSLQKLLDCITTYSERKPGHE